jgi:hypothetical protein
MDQWVQVLNKLLKRAEQSLMLLAQMLLDIYIDEGMAIEMTMDLDLLLVHVHGQ